MRARRSSAVMGGAGLGSGFSAAIDAGTGLPVPLPRPCCALTDLLPSSAIAAAEL
jgi:hypothetical protein